MPNTNRNDTTASSHSTVRIRSRLEGESPELSGTSRFKNQQNEIVPAINQTDPRLRCQISHDNAWAGYFMVPYGGPGRPHVRRIFRSTTEITPQQCERQLLQPYRAIHFDCHCRQSSTL